MMAPSLDCLSPPNSGFKRGQLMYAMPADGGHVVGGKHNDEEGVVEGEPPTAEGCGPLGHAPLSAGGCHSPRLFDGACSLQAGVWNQVLPTVFAVFERRGPQ